MQGHWNRHGLWHGTKLPAWVLGGLARSVLAASAGWVAGTALQLQQSALWQGWVYASISALALAGIAQAATKLVAISARGVAIFGACAALAFALTGWRSTVFLAHALDPALEGRDVLVTGVVSNLPQRNDAGLRFRLHLESAELAGQPLVLPPRVDVGWYAGVYPTGNELVGLQRQPVDVRAGERWTMTLRLKAPHGSSNPHGFDYELFLWEQGVQATGYMRAGANDPPPQRLAQTWLHPVALARQTLRERIFMRVEQRQFAGLIAALVVGDQNAIDRVDWDVFRATGIAHLVSISGLHITMFAWGAALLVGWAWRRSAWLCQRLAAPHAALLGGVALACAYALFSGWGVPSQRTCLMLATVAGLRLSGARWPWPMVWALACAVVVAASPWALLQAGFWLSFVAVGVLFATDLGAGYALSTVPVDFNDTILNPDEPAPTATVATASKAHVGQQPWTLRAWRSVLALLREQWVVTVALAPLTLLLFGQVSLVGLVANALAIPWVTLVVTPLAMLGVLLPALWDLAAQAVAWMLALLQWLAAWPWATWAMARPPVWAAAAGVFGGVLLVAQLPRSVRALGVPLLLSVLLWKPPGPAPQEFSLLAADVGQGNAVLVRTAHHALLYDAGPRYSLESDAGHRVLVPLLQALDVQLDRVVLSHRDTDHVGGAAAVLTMQKQADVLSSIGTDHPLQAVRSVQRCVAGQQWDWDGVHFTVLHPRAQDYDNAAKPNALSCVLRIDNGHQSALLVGDIEQAQEARLVADAEGTTLLHADLLLVPHHGSKTSSSAAFLDAVQPNLAVVQSGYRNRFGHPAAPVMQRYADRSILVRDSPHCGALLWASGSDNGFECARTEQMRYWHHLVP
jgi:competence protein ComEC